MAKKMFSRNINLWTTMKFGYCYRKIKKKTKIKFIEGVKFIMSVQNADFAKIDFFIAFLANIS